MIFIFSQFISKNSVEEDNISERFLQQRWNQSLHINNFLGLIRRHLLLYLRFCWADGGSSGSTIKQNGREWPAQIRCQRRIKNSVRYVRRRNLLTYVTLNGVLQNDPPARSNPQMESSKLTLSWMPSFLDSQLGLLSSPDSSAASAAVSLECRMEIFSFGFAADASDGILLWN